MPLNDIHARLFITTLAYCLVMALWAFWRFFRKQGVDSSYWGALVIAEVLLVIQGALGAYLYFVLGLRPARASIHILYGVISLLSIPGAYAFTKGGDQHRDMLVYGAVLAFQCGIILRAAVTGGF